MLIACEDKKMELEQGMTVEQCLIKLGVSREGVLAVQQGGRVLIRGGFCPMAGRMCMDQLLVDVTALPDVQAGDVVTLIGRDGAQELRAEELAARCGTITNELLSRLGRRLELQKVPRSSQSSGRSAETRG